ncbi:GGDEF domain-containing protein [Desulforhopalus vacuolatus]|uniref:sensor domain-containing diguanylate cyclase n=1 Tax=Desulforhopalus vacuolatus TaxID=40414 RepID=UPI0019642D62|nr:sensor domain-containing diguanylate cyclase [Desulforhopalus vacuolatus]MBM9519131.1 GGDEF domain-containing protein [Desulforhopalus vacuolatus]
MIPNKKKVMLVFSIILITGFLLTSFVSYYTSRAALRVEIRQNELPLTSDTIYSEIQRDLLRPIFIASLMANDTFLRDWVLHGEKKAEPITRYLKEIQKKYGTFTSFFVSDKTKIYYQSEGILKTVNEQATRDVWYFRLKNLDAETKYEINIDIDMAHNDAMTIFINHKMFDYQGKYIGATGVGLQAHAVQELIDTYKQRYNRTIYFVDRQGAITLDSSDLPGPRESLFSMPGIQPFASHILASPETSVTYFRENKTVHLNTRFIPEFKWYLLVEQPEDVAIQTINRALAVNLLACAFITLIVLVLTYTVLTAYQKKVEKLAITDSLTGAWNRTPFQIIFTETLKDWKRKGGPLFSVILLDLDHFKEINDTYGHPAGDEVLKALVQTMQQIIRRSDVIFRWGGEEFLLLLKECPPDQASVTAEMIREKIKLTPFRFEDRTITVTISLGVAGYRNMETKESLISRADQAMYRAKQQGRDRTEMAVEE